MARFRTYLPRVDAQARMPECTIVWISPDEGLDRTWARHEVRMACDYWRDRGHPIAVSATEYTHQIADPYVTWTWLRSVPRGGSITCAVLGNLQSMRQVDLGGGVFAYGYCLAQQRLLFACSTGLYAPDKRQIRIPLGAIVAHEVGHIWGYADGDPTQPIMGPIDRTWAAFLAERNPA
jgi:hypothetical protein